MFVVIFCLVEWYFYVKWKILYYNIFYGKFNYGQGMDSYNKCQGKGENTLIRCTYMFRIAGYGDSRVLFSCKDTYRDVVLILPSVVAPYLRADFVRADGTQFCDLVKLKSKVGP